MKKYLISAGLVIVAVGLFFAGQFMVSQPKLGSYYSSVGAIIQTDPTYVNVLSGLTVVGNLTQGSGGFTSFSTSTIVTPAQFLAISHELITGTTANATFTLPAATTTYLLAGSPALGGWQTQFVDNVSTNTATFVAGAGMTFKCETQGVGTTSIVGGCTGTQVTLPASTSVATTGFWVTSSTFYIDWGNMYY